MRRCANCGEPSPTDARFCMNCGQALLGSARPRDSSPQPAPSEPKAPAGAPPTAAAKSGTRVALVAVAVLVAIGGLIPFLLMSGKGCSSSKGSLAIQGGPWGEHTIAPTLCNSGQHMQFFGVALFANPDGAPDLVLIEDALNGAILKVQTQAPSCQPNCPVVALTPNDCTKFDYALERTNSYVNDIRLLDGRVDVDCTLPSGATIAGRIDFESCD